MPYDKHKMQDLTYSEYKNGVLERYKTLWTNGNFAGINELLETSQLKYKIFDAFNWNRLINLINDQTSANAWDSTNTYKIYDVVSYNNYTWVSKQDNNLNNAPQTTTNFWQQLNPVSSTQNATYDSLVGKWQTDYPPLQKLVENFKYVGVWASGQDYKLGNLINTDEYHSYFCLQEHTSSTTNQPPNTTYWVPAETMLASIGIQVSVTPPTNLTVGDMYFQIID